MRMGPTALEQKRRKNATILVANAGGQTYGTIGSDDVHQRRKAMTYGQDDDTDEKRSLAKPSQHRPSHQYKGALTSCTTIQTVCQPVFACTYAMTNMANNINAYAGMLMALISATLNRLVPSAFLTAFCKGNPDEDEVRNGGGGRTRKRTNHPFESWLQLQVLRSNKKVS